MKKVSLSGKALSPPPLKKANHEIELLFQHGLTLQQQGKPIEAKEIYETVLKRNPTHFDALHLLGIIELNDGKYQIAANLIARAIDIFPRNPHFFSNLGNALMSLKQSDAALARYDQAIALQPAFAEAHFQRGNALQAQGRFDLAVASYDRAISINPQYAIAFLNRGNALLKLDLPTEALVSFDEAVKLNAHDALAHYNRANAKMRLKQYEGALADYETALQMHPNFVEALCATGKALFELQYFEHAVAFYNKAIELQAHCPEAYHDRGNALRKLKRVDEALASYESAIRIKPDFAEAYCSLGAALVDLRHLELAVQILSNALLFKPDLAEAYYNQGNALRELRKLDDAVESYSKAIALNHSYVGAHWNMANTLLCNGDFANGWPSFEWRWKTDSLIDHQRSFAQALWLGAESLEGKTILLHAEQGLGDTLQFCRYAPLVAAKGAKVILEVQVPLVQLLHCLPGDIRIIPTGSSLPEFDLHCPLMSLPLAFQTRLDSIPFSTLYLQADKDKSTFWQERLATYADKKRVGLVWNGGFRADKQSINEQRNIPLDQIAVLNDSEIIFVSLQKGDPAERELRERKDEIWPTDNLLIFTDELKDFSDTAALIDNLHLVISVDTSTAHLAAAMGKPVWLLNRYDGCWRWMLDGERSPWYDSVRIYRQQRFLDWSDVLARVQLDLHNMMVGGNVCA